MNEFTENKCLPNLHCLRTDVAHKNRKRLVLLWWLCDSSKIHCLTSEFHVKFHLKTDIALIASRFLRFLFFA